MTCGGKVLVIILYYPQLDLLIEGRLLIKFPGCPPPLAGTHRLIVGTGFYPKCNEGGVKLDTGKDRYINCLHPP